MYIKIFLISKVRIYNNPRGCLYKVPVPVLLSFKYIYQLVIKGLK